MIRISTGFSGDQKFIISNGEAHKAYYLFLNPEKRGIFENGLALIGKDIKDIQPDYHSEMGWNPSHRMGDDDWAEVRKRGIDTELKKVMTLAKEVSALIPSRPELIGKNLFECAISLGISGEEKKELKGGMKSIGDLLTNK